MVRKSPGKLPTRAKQYLFAYGWLTDTVMSSGQQALCEQARLEQNIRLLDDKIFNLETAYLENSPDIGNLIQGWCTNPQRGEQKKVPKQISDEDRIFSNTSATYIKVMVFNL